MSRQLILLQLNTKKSSAPIKGKGDQLVISWKSPYREVRGENRLEDKESIGRTRNARRLVERNRWRKARRRESVRRKEIALGFYRGKEREIQTRATMLPAAQVHSMSALSLASGLESRGRIDRTSIGRLLVPPL